MAEGVTYAWGTGLVPSRARSCDAAVVGRVVTQLAASSADGACSAQAYVDHARDPQSETHETLTWDDTEAAEAYRRDEARHIIRSIVIKVPDEERVAPVFLNVRQRVGGVETQGYKPTVEVLSDEDLHRQVVDGALAGLRAYQRRYAMLKELTPVWDVLDKVEAEFGHKSD